MTLPWPPKAVATGQGLRVEEEPLACYSPYRKRADLGQIQGMKLV